MVVKAQESKVVGRDMRKGGRVVVGRQDEYIHKNGNIYPRRFAHIHKVIRNERHAHIVSLLVMVDNVARERNEYVAMQT